ncbi:Nucleolar and coiled-body phosphoprotein 1 [Euphorbia peplus]|nr:Nucleolar and coiled-body phosphoprotein 1 [Euphorbia peplus]
MKVDDFNGDLKTLVQGKTLLFNTLIRYLQRTGFSKTVKKFLSEAKIQKDDLGDEAFDLEEMFNDFVDLRKVKSQNMKGGGVDVTSAIELPGDGKKKKGDKESKSKNAGEVIDDAIPVDVKSKEKNKTKNDATTCEQEEVSPKVLEETENGTNEESKQEKKKKKKKKDKKSSDPVIDEGKPNKTDSKEEVQISEKDETEKENKSSKKRKRVVAEEDVVQPANEKVVEESKPKKKDKSKRRKTEVSEETKVEEESPKAQKEEDTKVTAEQVNGLSNGSLEENGEKSAVQNSTKKEMKGSAEPKAVKHFQRVKVEEVVFSDERLKNNSYWAKDGADIGYGAKAQEILEQVRGRDFRHEKTKKKRGSYRGGQIDLNSHSVKFNYSDEE